MTSQKPKKLVSIMIVLTMILTLLPATLGLAASYESIEQFVKNVYEVGLGREADEGGFNYWVKELEEGRPAAEFIGYVLLDAPEFKEKYEGISNDAFVKKAYEIVFNREADEAGLKFWKDEMSKGGSQKYVIVAMLYAPPGEFKEFCEDMGIKLGTIRVADSEKPGSIPAQLEVVNVSANNLKEVVVEFNQIVDEATIVDANFVVKKDSTTVATTAQLEEDGKTVVLTVGTKLDNQGKYKVIIEKVKGIRGIEIKKTETAFTAFDATLPVVENVIVTGPNSFEILFNEPIEKSSGVAVEVKSENIVVGVNPTFTGFGTNRISVQLFTSMIDGKSYEVTVKNFEDYAGYKNIISTIELAYAKDTNAPVATVTKAEQEYVVVEFDKPVSGLSKDHFYHSFTAWKAIGIYKDAARTQAVNVGDKVSKVFVEFYRAGNTDSRPLPEGSVTFVVRNKVGSLEVKDNWNNKFAEAVFTVNVSADKVVPAVTEIKVESERSLKITFNKNVSFNESNIEVLKADGSAKPGVNLSVTGSGKEYIIDLGKNLSGKTILVNIKDVEDGTLAGNKLALYSETLTITDKTAPSVEKVELDATAGNEALYVFFNEAVSGTALDKANYRFVEAITGGTKLVAVTGTPSFFTDSKIVKIPLTAAQAAKVGVDYIGFSISNIEDIAGNKLVGQTVASFGTVGSAIPKVVLTTGAKVKAVDTLELTFDQFLPIVEMSAFTVNGAAPAAMEVSTNTSGNTVVTLKTNANNEFAYDLGDANKTYSIDPSNGRIENVFGTSVLATGTVTLVASDADKIAPKVDSVVLVDSTTIQVNFTEALNPSTIASQGLNGFSVNGGTLNNVTLDSGNTQLILTGTGFTANTDILYNGTNVQDANKNALAAFNHTDRLTAASITIVAANTSATVKTITVSTTNYGYVLDQADVQVYAAADTARATNLAVTVASGTTDKFIIGATDGTVTLEANVPAGNYIIIVKDGTIVSNVINVSVLNTGTANFQ